VTLRYSVHSCICRDDLSSFYQLASLLRGGPDPDRGGRCYRAAGRFEGMTAHDIMSMTGATGIAAADAARVAALIGKETAPGARDLTAAITLVR
jgi:hypothetical protein